jgi:hypothetical protein
VVWGEKRGVRFELGTRSERHTSSALDLALRELQRFRRAEPFNLEVEFCVTLGDVLRKARCRQTHGTEPFNDRQRQELNRLLDGFEGKLTSSKWAKLARCSQDAAFRHTGGGRCTNYSLPIQ